MPSRPGRGTDGDPLPRSPAAALVGVTVVTLLLVASLSAPTILVSDGPEPPVSDDAALRLERLGCFGSCPAFTVLVCGDGTVHYLGKEFVNVTGPAEYRVSEERVRDLFALADRSDVFNLADRYRADVVDGPRAAITFRRDGRSHRVEFDSFARPEELDDLVAELDDVAQPYGNGTGVGSGEHVGGLGLATC